MTQIQKLAESTTFESGDKIAIYSNKASRTRSLSFDSLKKSLRYVSDITAGTSTLIVHYSDGTQKELTL